MDAGRVLILGLLIGLFAGVSWKIRGPPGPQGSDGTRGARGILGPAATGPPPVTGPQGPSGPQGALGPAGLPGSIGSAGDPAAYSGATLTMLPFGSASSAVSTYNGSVWSSQVELAEVRPVIVGTVTATDVGPSASVTDTTATGPEGPVVDLAFDVPLGPSGAQGFQGPQAGTGAVGPQGPPGPAAAVAPTGPQGLIGLPGLTGPPSTYGGAAVMPTWAFRTVNTQAIVYTGTTTIMWDAGSAIVPSGESSNLGPGDTAFLPPYNGWYRVGLMLLTDMVPRANNVQILSLTKYGAGAVVQERLETSVTQYWGLVGDATIQYPVQFSWVYNVTDAPNGFFELGAIGSGSWPNGVVTIGVGSQFTIEYLGPA